MNPEYKQSCIQIKEKLKEVQRKRLTCFGSDTHGFKLRPPATKKKINQFEYIHGIQLPDCYKTFVLEVGQGGRGSYGGAGPYYGLYDLDKWDDFATWIQDEPLPCDFLHKPCSFRPGSNRPMKGNDEFELKDFFGTISIGTQGCTFMTLLVVTGPYAGRVLYTDANGPPVYMSREKNFLAWYERWLDELLHGHNLHQFGYGPSGGEYDFFEILKSPNSSEEERTEAAFAFCRLPALSEDGRYKILEYCNDPSPEVRIEVFRSIETHKVTQALEKVHPYLQDTVADVRKQVIRCLMKLAPEDWHDAVFQMALHEESEDVATTAVDQLRKTETLSRERRLQLGQSSPHGSTRSSALYNMEWKKEDLERLAQLLNDSNSDVRQTAISGIRTLKMKELVPKLVQRLKLEDVWFVKGSLIQGLGELGDASIVPYLIENIEDLDDFHQLDSIEAVAQIGDERIIPFAKQMLKETRSPEKRDASGLSFQSSIHSIQRLVKNSLAKSPNIRLRKLGESSR